MRPEATGLERRSRDVVSDAAEPQRGAAKVAESARDALGAPVGGAGVVEEHEHVQGTLLPHSTQGASTYEAGGTEPAGPV